MPQDNEQPFKFPKLTYIGSRWSAKMLNAYIYFSISNKASMFVCRDMKYRR